MAKYKRYEVITQIYNTAIMPLYYNSDVELCKNIVTSCYKAGIKVFEYTNRGDFAHEVFKELNQFAISKLPGMILGVGSVIDENTAALYIQLGANFIVSPILNENMAKICNRRKVLWIPGCATLSEISKAEELGAEIVKIFPAKQLGGYDFVKSIKAPCPWTSIMPSGGVEPNEDNLRRWFQAGVSCVGMGSNLFPENIINQKNWNQLENTLQAIYNLVQQIKNEF